ncbi:MAG: sulfite exporter TauE/SafE family protein [Actinomycetota bacterium]|nr:sulfite exporter TauE/SafE family protein [Actinomycetota bacterium]
MSGGTLALVVVAGLVVGILSALFGVGGGLLMVPFMVVVLDESQHVAEGTSLLVIVPTAVVGVLAHLRRGYVSFKHAALVGLGGTAGALLGSSLALAMDAEALQNIFAVFLILMGARTIHQGAISLRADPTTKAEK